MKSIPVNLLKPGMSFSEPVYIDEDNILVPAGIPIREKDIEKVGLWGIEAVQTDGHPVMVNNDKAKQEAAPEPARKSSPPLPISDAQKKKKDAYRTYISLIEQLDTVFQRIITEENPSRNAINTISIRLLQAVRTEGEQYVGFILGAEVHGFELAKSSVNIAILSFLTAQELKLPHHRVLNVIIGALLHDAGMLRLPKKILEKRGGLSDAERRQISSHPVLGHKIVTWELNYPDDVGSIVHQHHERWDGGGYPFGMAGEGINIGARIVTIADAFEAMVSQKPYRNSMVGYQAMKNLLADNSRRFDPNILKIFFRTMGVYPIGSIVGLNNGTVARVTEARADTPLRPKIQVLIDQNNKALNNQDVFIDLLLEKNLFITRAVDPKELPQMT